MGKVLKKIGFLMFVMLYFLNFSYAEEAQEDGNDAINRKQSKSYQSYDELFDLYQPYLKNVKAYEPIYFLMGANPEKSKFQFSFRFQLFNKDASLIENYDWLKGLNFGYTQTSFWDLKSNSKPFKDTSYKPEIFYLSTNLVSDNKDLKGVFLQTGLKHESNGQAGDISRSTNSMYLKPIFMFYDPSSLVGMQISPKAWFYLENDDDNNPDLKDYRGYFDLEVKLGREDRAMLESHFRPAREGNSVELALTYPIQKYLANNIGVYLNLQYVNSLAENMINYKERTEVVRLGISLVR
ncbi:MAG: phospholipase A [Candidatus Omnitrophica bacterium]|nr:phospholipase A [Candidatus Omnitrophota bacterium]